MAIDEMPNRWWEPGCEDANSEPDPDRPLWMEDEELPFE